MLAAALAIVCALGGQQPATSQPASPTTQVPAPTAPKAPSPPETRDEKQHEADVQSDIEEGKHYAEEVEKQYKLSTNKEYQDRVQRIGAEIAAIANAGPAWHVLWGDSHLSKFDYTYKVIKSSNPDDVNAFSLPGGHVYVFEALVKEVESDDELAGVLAHESAHAAFRHVPILEKQANKVTMMSLPLILAAILLGSRNGAQPDLILPAAQLGTQAAMSGWSVKAEEAADYGGMQFLLKSHYDPTGMLTFMERLAGEEKLGVDVDWGIYRDHPPSRERAETLAHYMTDAGVQIRRSRVTTSYRVTVHPADNGLIEVDFGKRPLFSFGGSDALTRADAATDLLNSFFDATPELFDIQPAGPGGLIWKGKPLITFTADDATAENSTVPAVRDKALQAFRVAMYSLGFHVWTSR